MSKLRISRLMGAILLSAAVFGGGFSAVASAKPRPGHKHHAKHHRSRGGGIPQNGGGDNDADNHGGPSDGDGNK
jgi:hypothetical protein